MKRTLTLAIGACLMTVMVSSIGCSGPTPTPPPTGVPTSRPAPSPTVAVFQFIREPPNVTRNVVIQVPPQKVPEGSLIEITPAPLPTDIHTPMVLPTKTPGPGEKPIPEETLINMVIEPRVFIHGSQVYEFTPPLTITVCFLDSKEHDQAVDKAGNPQWSILTHYIAPDGKLHWQRFQTKAIPPGTDLCPSGGLTSEEVSTLHPNDPADEGGP